MQEIHALVEPKSQADPKFQTPLAHTRITAKAVREQLVANATADGRHVPAERTRDTSDFVADCLEPWWTNRQAAGRRR